MSTPKPDAMTADDLRKHPELYGARLSCEVARDCLNGKRDPPAYLSRGDWALYHLLLAVEKIATALMKTPDKQGDDGATRDATQGGRSDE